jgi:RNA polymerase sigma-70 factor (ECF subfamily)
VTVARRGSCSPSRRTPASVSPPTAPGADEVLDRGRLQKTFLRLAAGLAPKQRAVFVLKEIEGLDTDEVARVLEISESTVRNHLHQARRILREALRREHPEWS